MEFVALDLGASSTRYASSVGKMGVIPNNMVFLGIDDKVDLEVYSDEIDSSLDITIESDKESPFFPVRVLIGDMANRYSATNVRPSVMYNKHIQKINYVSAVAASAISKLKHGLGDKLSLYLALPPIEVKKSKDYVSENLQMRFKVTFNKLKNKVV